MAMFDVDALSFTAMSEKFMDELKARKGHPAQPNMLKYAGTELNKRRHELLMAAGGSAALEWESEESNGGNTARSWLTRNIRVEQKHAEWYKDWAQSAGVPLDRLYDGPRPAAATVITGWCWYVCKSGGLAEAMAATNYAVEGVTGGWTRLVAASEKYRELFTESERRHAMRWIHAHASYDDSHPVEALDIIAGLVGKDPEHATVRRIQNAIQKSYDFYLLALDKGLDRL
ncbi:MAG: iron-containing redox enzyme family protein [Nitrospirae bacterium]|nr:iron-containing redox enzyme family protein [Nitrospirota bacterium]